MNIYQLIMDFAICSDKANASDLGLVVPDVIVL
jgi:hypothetical protein